MASADVGRQLKSNQPTLIRDAERRLAACPRSNLIVRCDCRWCVCVLCSFSSLLAIIAIFVTLPRATVLARHKGGTRMKRSVARFKTSPPACDTRGNCQKITARKYYSGKPALRGKLREKLMDRFGARERERERERRREASREWSSLAICNCRNQPSTLDIVKLGSLNFGTFLRK